MDIPDYQTCMLPVLNALADGQVRHFSEILEAVADHFALTSDQRTELLPSGRGTLIRSRVGWAKTYLAKAGLLQSPKRGYWGLSDRGRQVLRGSPTKIDNEFLEQFPEFLEFTKRSRSVDDPTPARPPAGTDTSTPEEALDTAYQSLRRDLEVEVLDRVKGCSPQFFESVVVELLVKMGYGGSRHEAAATVGRSGDGGIDGIIKEDRLGLDLVYLQAKRWEGTVGRPEIQKFAGALQGQRARKGVFLTTSSFSREAIEFAANIDSKIVLIDGEMLARLMIDHGLGVTTVDTYEIKRIDGDYFEGE